MQDWISQAAYGGEQRPWKYSGLTYLLLDNLGVEAYCCNVYVSNPHMKEWKEKRANLGVSRLRHDIMMKPTASAAATCS